MGVVLVWVNVDDVEDDVVDEVVVSPSVEDVLDVAVVFGTEVVVVVTSVVFGARVVVVVVVGNVVVVVVVGNVVVGASVVVVVGATVVVSLSSNAVEVMKSVVVVGGGVEVGVSMPAEVVVSLSKEVVVAVVFTSLRDKYLVLKQLSRTAADRSSINERKGDENTIHPSIHPFRESETGVNLLRGECSPDNHPPRHRPAQVIRPRSPQPPQSPPRWRNQGDPPPDSPHSQTESATFLRLPPRPHSTWKPPQPRRNQGHDTCS